MGYYSIDEETGLPYGARECQHFEGYWILTYGYPHCEGRVYKLVNGENTVKVSDNIHDLYDYMKEVKNEQDNHA